MNIQSLDLDELPDDVLQAMGNLRDALIRCTKFAGAQITMDHFRDPEREMTIDVKVYE